LKNCTLRVTTA